MVSMKYKGVAQDCSLSVVSNTSLASHVASLVTSQVNSTLLHCVFKVLHQISLTTKQDTISHVWLEMISRFLSVVEWCHFTRSFQPWYVIDSCDLWPKPRSVYTFHTAYIFLWRQPWYASAVLKLPSSFSPIHNKGQWIGLSILQYARVGQESRVSWADTSSQAQHHFNCVPVCRGEIWKHHQVPHPFAMPWIDGRTK